MAKLKPILPSLREKKRYLVFEVVSKNRSRSFENVKKAIWQGMLSFNGTKGAAMAGMQILPEKYNQNTQRGIIRVNHKELDSLRAGLATVQEIDGPAMVRSISVSGSLKKASTRIAG